MRKKRTLLVLILAIVSGSLAGYSALRYLQDRATPLLVASQPEKTQSDQPSVPYVPKVPRLQISSTPLPG